MRLISGKVKLKTRRERQEKKPQRKKKRTKKNMKRNPTNTEIEITKRALQLLYIVYGFWVHNAYQQH
jgi:hypothetical protein